MSRPSLRAVLSAGTSVLLTASVLGAANPPLRPAVDVDTAGLAATAAERPFLPIEPHEPSTADRYSLAGGCFTMAVAATDAPTVRVGAGYLAPRGAPDARRVAFHLEPTDLGSYLLYGDDRRFLAASEGALATAVDAVSATSAAALADGVSQGQVGDARDAIAGGPANDAAGRGDRVVAADGPSELADWVVDEAPGGFVLRLPAAAAVLTVADDGALRLQPDGGEAATPFRFESVEGCAPWPEVDLNVEGPLVRGTSRSTETRGYLDSHVHPTGFERVGGRARCGRPWHPYGVTFALRGCPEHEDAGGRTHVLAAVLSGRDPVAGHDTTGWPTFADWPAHDELLYEQAYHRWLERAWRGGLRVLGNLFAENEQLCTLYPLRDEGCNEMESVRRQAERTYELERYIDARYGGPGRGWFRIVTDPFQARRVINEGRLAVVLGIEVSRLFDCRTVRDVPTCDAAAIDRQLDEISDLGVRYLLMTNWFDNALTGVKGHPGQQGIFLNQLNALETGGPWRMERCDAHDRGHDTTQLNAADEGVPGADGAAPLFDALGPLGVLPLYPPGPHCNVRGLTDLGHHVLERVVSRGMIFDPDHMSARARHEALDVLEDVGYSGVVSSHSWADDEVYRRVLALGGVVTPKTGDAVEFADEWRRQRAWVDDRFLFGFGIGSDLHGFADLGGPRDPDAAPSLTYPFEGFAGVRLDRQVSGERTFDINIDGVAHYGLYPDWFEDLGAIAGEAITSDLERGAEAYLQMWERAVGVPPDSCRSDVVPRTREELLRIPRGTPPEGVLVALGQPRERRSDEFVYCLPEGHRASVHLGPAGVERVTFSAARNAGG